MENGSPLTSPADILYSYVLDECYVENLQKLLPIFTLTRLIGLNFDPDDLLNIQEDLVHRVTLLMTAVREGKQNRKAAMSKGDHDEVEAIEVCIAANRHLVRLIQMIMDGMAWRLLGFDRPVLRLMSEPDRHLGSVNFDETFPGMKAKARELMVNNGSRILFNDLTNTLRLGDLTEILPNGKILVSELKRCGKTIRNAVTIAREPSAHVSAQVERMIKGQIALDLRRIFLKDGQCIDIDDLYLPLDNDLDAVSRAIRGARVTGVKHTAIGQYLYVEAYDLPRIADLKYGRALDAKLATATEPNWSSADEVVVVESISNCMSDGMTFARNLTPYAIFPFSVRDCFDLMSGQLLLRSWINLSEVGRLLTDFGWRVTDLTKNSERKIHESLRRSPSDHEPLDETETISSFRLSRTPFNIEIPLQLVLRIGFDFIRPTVIAAVAESSYRASVFGQDRIADSFVVGERDVWV